ncbi:MAG: tRNA-specific adenosine deaminase [Anaerolineaceae bacterium]|nr:tRNA-specific adenosine deaminase [Anaerolineaceae bacterium]
MDMALREAAKARQADEVPIGCCIVRNGKTIARAHNQRQMLHDPTAHAEMIAITQAAEAMGDWRLTETALYVTLEPCAMCAGAIVLARIPRVVFGVRDAKAGAVRSLYQLLEDRRLNHTAEVVEGVLPHRCRAILQEFFQHRRSLGEK